MQAQRIAQACSARSICAIWLDDDPQPLVRQFQDAFPNAHLIGADGGFERLLARVVALIETPRIGLELSLDIRGTVLQQRIWQALRQIPPGLDPQLRRAGATHRPALCGALPGYRWSVERKQALLKAEAHGANA